VVRRRHRCDDGVGLEPLILFLIIFLWTPPHFWALSLNLAGDYARAGVPMLPVVAGRAETKRQILLYTVVLVPIPLLPWALGFAGAIYGAAAAMLGAIMIFLSWQVRRSNDKERQPARPLPPQQPRSFCAQAWAYCLSAAVRLTYAGVSDR